MLNNYIIRVKTLLLTVFVSLLTLVSDAQSPVTYPTGNPISATERRPFGAFYGFERTQAVYTPAELGIPAGSILTNVGFYLATTNGPCPFAYNTKIYVRETGSAVATGGLWSSLVPNTVNLMYDGDVTPSDWTPAGHWVSRTLSALGGPLLITTGSNLEFLIETNYSTSTGDPNGWFAPGNSDAIMFAHHSKTNGSATWQNDGISPSTSQTGALQAIRPNIQISYVPAVACTGAPTGVVANASANPTCATPFNLSLSGLPPNSGFTFQWFANGTPIPGATYPFYSVTQISTTSYYCQITCTPCGACGTTNSTTIVVNQNPVTNCYCASTATLTFDTDIGNVTFGSMSNGNPLPQFNNPTANGTYTNFTGSVPAPVIMQGQPYSFSMTQTTSGGGWFGAYCNVFIDYNFDGVFNPSTERVFSQGLTNSGNPILSGTISIPFSTGTGITRMRVILREFGNNTDSPCLTYSFGETEDYNVFINAGTPCTTPVVAGTTVSTSTNVCSNQPFTLSLSGNTSLGSGQTWQWEKASSCAGPWTATGAADTLPTLTLTQPTTPAIVYYHCVVTCSNCCSTPVGTSSCLAVNSNPATLCYCNTALHTNDCSGAFIQNVQIPSTPLNNNSGCTSGNSQSYTVYPNSGSTTATLVQNSTYTLSITTASSSQSISAWIDFDGNGQFNIYEWFGLTGNPPQMLAAGIYTIPVSVPGTSVTGLIGMRIRSRQTSGSFNDADDACTQFFSGETEDYLLTINPYIPPVCSAAVAPIAAIFTASSPCYGTQLNLSLTPTTATNFLNIAYQWELDTAGVWASIAGATLKNLTITPSRYTRYRCTATCTSFATTISAPAVPALNPLHWMGYTEEWADGANWCGRVPTTADSVQISLAASGRPAASYRAPILRSGAGQAFNLKLDATDTLTVLTDSLLTGLTVNQHLVNNGKIIISSTTGDSTRLGESASINTLHTPFRGSISDQICQIMYTPSELLNPVYPNKRLQLNDVIDALAFHLRLRTSVNPYENFRISYGLTTDLQFSSTTLYSCPTQIYFNSALNIAALVPGTSGTLTLPVSGFKWTDTTKSIVIQICFDTQIQRPNGNDFLYLSATPGLKKYLQISSNNLGDNGCSMTASTPGSTVTFTPSFTRPNVTFLFNRPQKRLTASIGASGGGFKNNGSGSAFTISNTDLTITGALLNDGLIRVDTTNITLSGDFTNGSVTDFSYAPTGTQRKSNFYFNGTNWTNNGTFTPGTKSRVVFGNSLVNNVIGGTTPTSFSSLRIEKGGGLLAATPTQTITLNQPIVVGDSLTMYSGRIVMNKKSITINNPLPAGIIRLTPFQAYLVADDSLSKINWNIGIAGGLHTIPFGNATVTNPNIPFSITNTGDLGMFTVATYSAPGNLSTTYPPGVTHVNNTSGSNNAANTVDRYWILSKTSLVGTANSSNLSFAFTDGERPPTIEALNPGKAQPWGQAGGWRVAPASQVYSFQPTSPNPPPLALASRVHTVTLSSYAWTFGNNNPWSIATSLSPLPISLLSFKAKAVDDKTRLDWVTASEENNDYFTVERTLDFNNTVNVAQVPSQGNSNDMQTYQAWDESPKSGINYYRLMQTDFGGNPEPVSEYVAVRFGVKSNFNISYVTNETNIEVVFDYDSNEAVDYTVTDMLGKTIASGLNNPAEPGVNILKLDASTWPHGMYSINLQNSEKRVSHKLVY